MAYHKCASIYGTNNSAASVQTASGAIVNFNTQLALPIFNGVFELPYRKNGYTKINVNKSSGSTVVRDKVPYLFRTSGGSIDIGESEEDMLVGGTVAFNQLVNPSDFALRQGITPTFNNGIISLSGTPSTTYANFLNPTFPLIAGHIYIGIGKVIANPNNLSFIYALNNGEGGIRNGDMEFMCKMVTTKTSGFGANTLDTTTDYTGFQFKANLIDLTQMFGSTIADYIYSLEHGTAGAGVAWFRSLFPKDYYAYNAGELMSVKASKHIMTGFNAWDEESESGRINVTTGQNSDAEGKRSKNYTRVIPNTAYYFRSPNNINIFILEYDFNKNFLRYTYKKNKTYTISSDAHFIRFYETDATNGLNGVCVNLSWDGERDGEYEPYVKYEYPLDSNLELRGIPKLDANNKLYYDGDTYESDGTVTRKYGVVDLGTLDWKIGVAEQGSFWATLDIKRGTNNLIAVGYTTKTTSTGTSDLDNMQIKSVSNLNAIAIKNTNYINATAAAFKTAISGVYLVYELATPTTEEADTFTNPQKVNDFGTEEYEDNRAVPIPVGHDTFYSDGITIATKSFGQTIYGGEFNSVTGELTSSYNADGTQKQTPDIIQLSPLEIISFIGNNNIWSDANGNSSIKYKKIVT